MHRYRSTGRSAHRLRIGFAILAAAFSVVASDSLPANAVDSVDIDASIYNGVDAAVTDSPVALHVSVNNSGTATATHVAVAVAVPTGAVVFDRFGDCTLASSVLTCAFGPLEPNESVGASIYLTFAATGTYAVTATARADQNDADGESTDQIAIDVGDEHADLFGVSHETRILVGSQSVFSLSHVFSNHGPTAAGDASVSGTVTGGATIVADSFEFVDGYSETVDYADDNCTVTPTTFTCAPVYSISMFEATHPFIAYDVLLPATPSTVVASATITGRADPDHGNDDSVITIDVDEPAAEIFTQLVAVPNTIPSGEPFRAQGLVLNSGELDAQTVVALFGVPAGWEIAVPPGPLPPGVACSIVPSPHAMRCTRSTYPAGEWWEIYALVTPPAGSGTGTVTLSVSTVTPEIGVYPNTASTDIRYRPLAGSRTLHVDPATDLEDGDNVTITGDGFPENVGIYYCQGVITSNGSVCGVPFASTSSTADGSFLVDVGLERFLVVPELGVVDCAQPASMCVFGATDLTGIATPALVPLSFTPQTPVDDPFDARISGTVTDANGNPVPGARVWAFRESDTWVGTEQTTTDASGNYVLEDAEPGIGYHIAFGAPSGSGLVTEWYGGPTSPGVPTRSQAIDVRLSAIAPTLDADAALADAGSITGTVVGPSGAPLPNVTVWAYRADDTWLGTYAATTDATGVYRIEAAPPGTPLRIRFVPATGSGLAIEWFDNASVRAAATPVVVDPGAPTNANAQLANAP